MDDQHVSNLLPGVSDDVEKVAGSTRPKTPQTFGNMPAAELFGKETAVATKNEKNRELAPSAPVDVVTDIVSNGKDSSESRGSSSGKQDDGKSLINSVPKPFKPESNWNEKSESSSPHLPSGARNQQTGKLELRKDATSDSVASAISLSSSGSEHSLPKPAALPSKPVVGPDEQFKRPFDNLLQSSPGGSSSSLLKPDKRDSKVIKAAQYWNNFIGDMSTKTKPAEVTKVVEKPQKIISAGVGKKGYNDLKTAFEQKNKKEPVPAPEKFGGMQRRNSKKLTIDGCQPGLRVNDALSVFESKNQPSTPVIYRRNSVKDGGQPKWISKQPSESEHEHENIATSPITVLKKEDIENIKQMNSNPSSPEVILTPERLVNRQEIEKTKLNGEEKIQKKDNKPVHNGIYGDGLDKVQGGKNSKKDVIAVRKFDIKENDADVMINNKINLDRNIVIKNF